MSTSRTGQIAAIIFVGLVLRLLVAAVHTPLPDGDESIYVDLAVNLAERASFRISPDQPLESHFGPLLPVLASPLVRAGVDKATSVRAVSMAAGALLPALVFLIACHVFGQTGAYLAATAALIHPSLVSFSRLAYPEMLSSCLILTAIFFLIVRDSGVGFAISMVAACLTRRETIVMVPFCLLLFAIRERAQPNRPFSSLRTKRVALAIAVFTLCFAPYLFFIRYVTGHWGLSGRASYVFHVGRLMEKHAGRPFPMAEVKALQTDYPDPVDFVEAFPQETAINLSRSAGFHLASAFFGRRAFPFGVAALLGLALSVKRQKTDRWTLAVLLTPFILVAAWAVAGPFQRYSVAIQPVVCLLIAPLGTCRRSDFRKMKPAE